MRILLKNEQWKRIEHMLPGKAGDSGRRGEDNRKFVEAVLWIARTGSPWRVCRRNSGHGTACTCALHAGAAVEHGSGCSWSCLRTASLPSVCIWIPPSCEPISMQLMRQKNGAQALGCSRGGLSTKIHALVQGMGQLIGFALTGGEMADISKAQGLLCGLQPKEVVADKGYDPDEPVQFIRDAGAKAVIPPRRNRRHKRR